MSRRELDTKSEGSRVAFKETTEARASRLERAEAEAMKTLNLPAGVVAAMTRRATAPVQ